MKQKHHEMGKNVHPLIQVQVFTDTSYIFLWQQCRLGFNLTPSTSKATMILYLNFTFSSVKAAETARFNTKYCIWLGKNGIKLLFYNFTLAHNHVSNWRLITNVGNYLIRASLFKYCLQGWYTALASQPTYSTCTEKCIFQWITVIPQGAIKPQSP